MRRSLLCKFAALLLLAACAHHAPYTWVQSLPPEPDPRTITTINPGDVVDVRVFGQDALSAKGAVRLDGTLTLPLLGQVTMAGQKPEDVAKQLKERLKPYVVAPEVTVAIEQSRVN